MTSKTLLRLENARKVSCVPFFSFPASSDFFDAKGVLRQKVFRDGSRRFLVEWEQAGAEPSWEPESNLSAPLLEDWESKAVDRYTPLPSGFKSFLFSHA